MSLFSSHRLATFSSAAAALFALSACASSGPKPERQLVVYERANRTVYVAPSHYRCYQGRLEARTDVSTPAADAETTTALIGQRCYYADHRGRPLRRGVSVGGEIGVGTRGAGGNIGVGVGGSGGGTRIGVGIGTRR